MGMGNLYRFNAVLFLFLCVLVVLGGLNSFDFKDAARRRKRCFSSKLSPTVKIYAALFCLSSDLCFSGFKYTSVMGSQSLILPLQRLGCLDFAVL